MAAVATATPALPRDATTRKTVTDCYGAFDSIFLACGLRDLTEGMYFGNPSIPYEQAQRYQAE